MIEAVIFDLDGTLISLPLDYEKLVEEFRKIAPSSDFHPLVPAIAKLDENMRTKIFKAWDKAELAITEKITLIREGKVIYDQFPDKPKALVTLQGKKFVSTILKPLGLYFSYIATREDSLERIRQLELMAHKLGKSFKNILFVGNTPNDHRAAEQLGCQYKEVKT